MRKKILYLNFIILSLAASTKVFSQAGTLNTSFGNGGIVTTSLGSGSAQAEAMAIQMDGKIVVAGTYNYNQFGVTRYNTTGTLDSSFGIDGIAITSFDVGHEGWAVAIQQDGKIIVAGDDGFAMVRYTTNGKLDSSFGINGIVVTTGLNGGYAVAIQTDGKIIMAGSGIQNETLARYKSNGSLDSTFGINGIVNSPIAGAIYAIALQPDGKIIAGSAGNNIRRYIANGTIDSSFGVNGTAVHIDNLGVEESNGITLQTDGKIVAACYDANDGTSKLVRYNNDGAFDSSFGTNGIVAYSSSFYISSSAMQTDGKILVTGGDTGSNKKYAIVTARYKTDGIIDSTFGTNGYTKTSIGDSDAYANSIQLYANKIYAAGYVREVGNNADFAVISYNEDAVLPITWLNFNGILQNMQAVLTWATANEYNNKGFEIEKSINGEAFSTIGFVPSHSSLTTTNKYTFADPKMLEGNNYYRLKQISNDGSYTYSSIIKLEFNTFNWSILGNPSDNMWAEVQLDKQSTVTLQILSLTGKVIQTINKGILQQGTFSIPLNLSHAAKSVYVVKLIVNNQIYSKNILN